jgi:hypothetical protein
MIDRVVAEVSRIVMLYLLLQIMISKRASANASNILNHMRTLEHL